MAWARWVVALGAVMTGGCTTVDFVCENDAQCVVGAARGSCDVEIGICEFPDATCNSGRRYGAHSPQFGGQCVAEEDTATGSIGSSTASDSSGSTPGSGPSSTSSETAGDSTTGAVSGSEGSSGREDSGSSGAARNTDGNDTTWVFGETSFADHDGVSHDTYLSAVAPENNYGVHLDMHFSDGGTSAGLVSFELEAIPRGATVLGAELFVHTRGGDDMATCVIWLYEVYEAWSEGAGNAQPGPANWDQRLDGVEWTAPGVGPGSRANEPLAELGTIGPNSPYSVPLPVNLVQAWVDNPADNHGMLITTPSPAPCAGGFVSSENSDETRRPYLTVTFE